MAVITWADVETVNADLSATPAALQTDILGYVNAALNPGVFIGGEDGSAYRLVRMFLAAHIGTLELTKTAGPIQSMSEGGVSVSYMPMSAISNTFSGTTYGQQVAMMIRTSIARGPWVT